MTDVKAMLRQLIIDKHLPGESPDNLRDDTPLQTSGILDSLAVLGVSTFVEQQFGIQLSASDTGIETFNTLDDIAGLIARKQQPALA
jgi:acyl carrier protein